MTFALLPPRFRHRQLYRLVVWVILFPVSAIIPSSIRCRFCRTLMIRRQRCAVFLFQCRHRCLRFCRHQSVAFLCLHLLRHPQLFSPISPATWRSALTRRSSTWALRCSHYSQHQRRHTSKRRRAGRWACGRYWRRMVWDTQRRRWTSTNVPDIRRIAESMMSNSRHRWRINRLLVTRAGRVDISISISMRSTMKPEVTSLHCLTARRRSLLLRWSAQRVTTFEVSTMTLTSTWSRWTHCRQPVGYSGCNYNRPVMLNSDASSKLLPTSTMLWIGCLRTM